MKKIYYIRHIEKIFDVGRKTFYYWEFKRKIPKAKRESMSNYRYWTDEDLKKLKQIIRKKR